MRISLMMVLALALTACGAASDDLRDNRANLASEADAGKATRASGKPSRDHDSDHDTDSDSDCDGDTDSDTDSDGDLDTDSDRDLDTDSDSDSDEACPAVPPVSTGDAGAPGV